MDQDTNTSDAAAMNRLVSLARGLLKQGSGGYESMGGGEEINRQEIAEALEKRIVSDARMSTPHNHSTPSAWFAPHAVSSTRLFRCSIVRSRFGG